MIKVINEEDVEPIRLPGRDFRVVASAETIGNKNSLCGVVEIPPGSVLPEHNHESSEEVMYIIAGKGVIKGIDEYIVLSPGSVVFVKPNYKHELVNTRNEVMKIFCSFSLAIKIGK